MKHLSLLKILLMELTMIKYISILVILFFANCGAITPTLPTPAPEPIPTVDAYSTLRLCQPMGVTFDRTISLKAFIAAHRALNYWNRSLQCPMFYLDLDRPDMIIHDYLISPGSNADLEEEFGPNFKYIVGLIKKEHIRGYPCVMSADIWVKAEFVEKNTIEVLESVYRHELAHALGLNDIPRSPDSSTSLMAPYRKTDKHPVDVNKEDLEYLKEIHCSSFK